MAPDFGNLKSDCGLAKLEKHMSTRSFVTGVSATSDDKLIFGKLIGSPPASKYPNAYRWYRHISHFSVNEQNSWPAGEIKEKKAADDDFDLFGDDDEGDAEAMKKLAEKKKAEAQAKDVKKKTEVISKSSLVYEIRPSGTEVDLDKVAGMVQAIKMDGVSWGETYKKIPLAFGLYKLQLACTILDDQVETDRLSFEIVALGLTAAQREELQAKIDAGDDEEDEEDEGDVRTVQSAEIVSFNKL